MAKPKSGKGSCAFINKCSLWFGFKHFFLGPRFTHFAGASAKSFNFVFVFLQVVQNDVIEDSQDIYSVVKLK